MSLKFHLMREKVAMLMFPTAGRMDHTIPAIRFAKQQSKKRGAERLVVEFLPLNNIASVNLPTFIESVKKNLEKDRIYENPVTSEETNIEFSNQTKIVSIDEWDRILEESIQDIKASSIFVGCTVALGTEIPEDIALQTSLTSLSHNDLNMIKIPTGYDIQTPPEFFNPDAQLSDQIKQHELLGSLSIKSPLIFIAKNSAVREVLMTIRKLNDKDKSKSLEGFKSREIRTEVNALRKEEGRNTEMTSPNLSNKLKHLKQYKLIKSTNAKHSLTSSGMVLSGILSD
tara:strand:- start:514 stop:1368 length:855 start_codon:yes stop_codon:yes gene_type:complete